MQGYAVAALGGPRWQALATTMRFVGADLTGADFRLQVRLLPNTPGAPLVDLVTVGTAAAEGVRLIGVETINGQKVSTIGIRVNETTMEGLPFAGEQGSSTVLAWDMQVTPAGGLKQKWIGGEFIVEGAVTGADTAPNTSLVAGMSPTTRTAPAGSSTFQIGQTIISVTLAGGEGPPGKASGPLGAGSVGSGEMTNDPADLAAVTGKLRYRAPFTGSIARPLDEKEAETVSIADLGGKDDWDGTTGTNNLVPLDRAFAMAPVRVRLPKLGTGRYMVNGATTVTNGAGVILDPDPGVEIIVVGTGIPATFIKGYTATRDLRTSYASLRYSQPAGPGMRRRVTELGRPGSVLNGELQVPLKLDFTTASHWQLTSWPNGGFVATNPTSVSANNVSWSAAPANSFAASVFHVLPGDYIQARVSDVATYLPAVTVFTDSGWIIVHQDKSGDLSILTAAEKVGSSATVETSTSNDVVAQTAYRLTKSAFGIAIFDQRSFGLVVNGIVIRRYRTAGNIQRAGWAGGFSTGAGFAIADAVLFKRKRTFGIKPLKVLTIGDSTGDETVTLQSQFDFMRQHIAGMGGCQIATLTNLAHSGDRSAQQLAALQSVNLAGAGYDNALIQIGINDIQTGVAVQTFVNNVLAMVTYCRNAGVEPIVGIPAMFYSQPDAQAFGQDGGATSHSADGAEYRLALMRALADNRVACNLASFEDMGAVVASLLPMKTSPWGDQVVYDNIHPTIWGAMLLGYGWAKALAAYHTQATEAASAGIPLPMSYAVGGVGASVMPTYSVSGDTLSLGFYLSVNGVALADNTIVAALPKRLWPADDVFGTLANIGPAPGLVPVAAAPGIVKVGSDGNVRVYGVAGSPTFLALGVSWKI